MSWPSAKELDSLVARFQTRTLPKPEWTHEAHLAVGTWHVHSLGKERTLRLIRPGIRLLNESHGGVNSDDDGYHETITRAYVHLIADFLTRECNGQPAAECAQALLASPLAVRDALLAYYSKDLLMSVKARRAWVEPDLASLRYPAVARPAAP